MGLHCLKRYILLLLLLPFLIINQARVNAFISRIPTSTKIPINNNIQQTPIQYNYNNPQLYASTKSTTTASKTKKKKQQQPDDNISFSFQFDTTKHKHRILIKCLFAILLYMSCGVLSYSYIFEKWPIVDSLYFSVVTFTTVGYGDLIPTTDAGRLFAILYAFAGISIVGALLGVVGVNIIEAEKNAIKRTRNLARTKLLSLFDPSKKKKKIMNKGKANWKRTRRERLLHILQQNRNIGILQSIYSRLFAIRIRPDKSKSLLRTVFDTFTDCYYIFVPFISLALYIGRQEGWSIITSIYYAMATASTVGYGDMSPTFQHTRLLSLLFIPLAVISLGEILSRIAGYFIRRDTIKAEKEFMSRRMTLEDLYEMDTNNSGEVDLFEFLSFMLSKMQKVDMELMNELKDLFESLDETQSNSIQKEDLLIMAQVNDWRDSRVGSLGYI